MILDSEKIMRKLLLILFMGLFCVSSLQADSATIKVGVTLPLSGRLAYVGQDIKRGMELAIEESSTNTLIFKTIYEDNKHLARDAASTAHKLLQVDDVDVLVSLWDMADVVAPLAEKKQVPHLAIRWNPHIAEEYSYTVTVESTYQSYMDSMIAMLTSQKLSKVGLLTEEAQGWILASDYFQKTAPTRGIEVSGDERYASDMSDHRSVVLRLLQTKPDLIILLSNSPHTEILIQRIRELAPKQKLTGYFENTEQPLLVEGIPFVSQFEAADWFKNKFQKRYNEPFKARAPQAYDIIHLLALLHKDSGNKLDGGHIMKALRKIHDVEGASGTLNVSASGSIESECVWKRFVKGKPQVLNTADISSEHAGL